MLGLPRSTFLYCTVGLVLLGSFSRFTRGEYTPHFYAYQEYHQADDGGIAAKIVPVVDLILGALALRPGTRLLATITIGMFMVMGLIIQISNGKRFELDILTIILSGLAVVEAS